MASIFVVSHVSARALLEGEEPPIHEGNKMNRALPTLLSAPAQDIPTSIQEHFTAVMELPEDKISIQILQSTDTHILGTVKESGTPTGGAHFFAVKKDDIWNIVFEGNERPDCEELRSAGFAESFLKNCTEPVVPETGNAITIYNENLALVKEFRTLDLEKGLTTISYDNVPKQIKANTVYFEDLENKTTNIVEQSYEYDLVSGDKLYEKFIDKDITVIVEQGQNTATISGTLLSYAYDGIVLKTENGIRSIQKNKIINTQFPVLPEGLRTKPTLVWTLWSDMAGSRETKTSYLTGGLSWSSDYVAVVNDSDTNLDLKGWTTINNRSGASFEDVTLKLVAGDVNIVNPAPAPLYTRHTMMKEEMAMDSSVAMNMATGGFGQESFFEYHLYSLGRETDLKDNATKQIELFNATDIDAEKKYIYDPQKSSDTVRTEINFENKEENNLGMALPKGTLRVYKKDLSGAMQFVGEDSIKHTPKNEDIDVFLGNAFDIVVEKKQTAYETTKNWVGFRECSFRTHEVEFKNHKDTPVTIEASEYDKGSSVEIQKSLLSFFDTTDEENEKGEKIEASSTQEIEATNEGNGEYVFDVPVKNDQKTVLSYTVRSCR